MHGMEPKVFVVDDERQIADILSLILREAEFDVETFHDPRSCLLRANDCAPDVLVTDISMPEMDGITLSKALRKQNPNCKVILMSGNPEWRTRAQDSDDFIMFSKPFSPSKLLRLIKAGQS